MNVDSSRRICLIKFNVRFYIIALVFIIFDVEVVFLSLGCCHQDFIASGMGALVLFEMFMFVVILLIGFAYVWIKGDLDWVKMKLKYASGRYADLKMEKIVLEPVKDSDFTW